MAAAKPKRPLPKEPPGQGSFGQAPSAGSSAAPNAKPEMMQMTGKSLNAQDTRAGINGSHDTQTNTARSDSAQETHRGAHGAAGVAGAAVAGHDTNASSTSASHKNAAAEMAMAQQALDVYSVPDLYKGRYTITKSIGKGAYGAVYIAIERMPPPSSAAAGEGMQVQGAGEAGGTRKVALKHIVNGFVSSTDARRIYREIKVMAHFCHPNIVPLLEVVKPADNVNFKHIYLVSELMETDLHRVIHSRQDLTSDHIAYFMYQTLCALKHIHSAGVLHRDLKPSNLLVNADCTLKMCDFGLARESDSSLSQALTEYVVTRWYRAPEVLLSGGRYTSAIDVWSAGCVLAELLLRRPLFPGENYLHQLQLITQTIGSPTQDDLHFVTAPPARSFMLRLPKCEAVPWASLMPHVRGPVLDLLNAMLTFDPDKRITVEEALAHPFLARVRAARRQVNEDVPPPRPFKLRVPGGSAALKAMPVEAIKGRFYAELCGMPLTPSPTTSPLGPNAGLFGLFGPMPVLRPAGGSGGGLGNSAPLHAGSHSAGEVQQQTQGVAGAAFDSVSAAGGKVGGQVTFAGPQGGHLGPRGPPQRYAPAALPQAQQPSTHYRAMPPAGAPGGAPAQGRAPGDVITFSPSRPAGPPPGTGPGPSAVPGPRPPGSTGRSPAASPAGFGLTGSSSRPVGQSGGGWQGEDVTMSPAAGRPHHRVGPLGQETTVVSSQSRRPVFKQTAAMMSDGSMGDDDMDAEDVEGEEEYMDDGGAIEGGLSTYDSVLDAASPAGTGARGAGSVQGFRPAGQPPVTGYRAQYGRGGAAGGGAPPLAKAQTAGLCDEEDDMDYDDDDLIEDDYTAGDVQQNRSGLAASPVKMQVVQAQAQQAPGSGGVYSSSILSGMPTAAAMMRAQARPAQPAPARSVASPPSGMAGSPMRQGSGPAASSSSSSSTSTGGGPPQARAKAAEFLAQYHGPTQAPSSGVYAQYRGGGAGGAVRPLPAGPAPVPASQPAQPLVGPGGVQMPAGSAAAAAYAQLQRQQSLAAAVVSSAPPSRGPLGPAPGPGSQPRAPVPAQGQGSGSVPAGMFRPAAGKNEPGKSPGGGTSKPAGSDAAYTSASLYMASKGGSTPQKGPNGSLFPGPAS